MRGRLIAVTPTNRPLIALLALLGLITGCQPAPPANQFHSPYMTDASVQNLTADQVVNTDPCVERLHDVAGYLLTYYADHKQLPENLDQLQSYADPGTIIDFTCPDTHQPYAYVPTGIRSPAQGRQIILYDSVPHPDGKRWCIFLSPAILHPGSSLVMDVLPVTQAAFRTFQPTAPN